MEDTLKSANDFNDTISAMQEFTEKAPLGAGSVESLTLNPQSGKVEKSYIDIVGGRQQSKLNAERETIRQDIAADMTVIGQLRRAEQKLYELKKQKAEAAQKAHEKAQKFNDEKLTWFGRLVAGGDIYRGQVQADPETNALDVAIRQTEELIKDLQEQKDREQGKDVGFWRGFSRAIGDFK